MHDRPGRPRCRRRGLPLALGASVVVLAAPALVLGATAPEDVADTTEAAADESAPVADATEAVADESAPAADTTEAVAGESAPVADTTEPAADESAPAADESAPAADESAHVADAPKPPRIDGTYLGATMFTGIGLLRVNDFDTDGAFASFGGTATIGQMVFPWLGLGLHGGGGGGVRSEDGARQRLGQGYLGVQFKFVPLAKRRLPLSLMASFGFGGGAVRQAGIAQRSGFGGAQFGAAVRYELFPFAKKRRPYRGGGFGLGPELGWVGFTPAAPGRPMSNVIYVALSTTFYFGS